MPTYALCIHLLYASFHLMCVFVFYTQLRIICMVPRFVMLWCFMLAVQ